MNKTIAVILAAVCTLTAPAAAAQTLPKKVDNIELVDLKKQATQLPFFGEKNLMIFYVDPDARKQNEEFTYKLEETHRAESPEIYGFGIINAKDTWFPDGTIRLFARKRTAKNGALVLMDKDRSLSRKWDLGDCNDLFVILFVNKAGELVYMHKGELTREEQEEFCDLIDEFK